MLLLRSVWLLKSTVIVRVVDSLVYLKVYFVILEKYNTGIILGILNNSGLLYFMMLLVMWCKENIKCTVCFLDTESLFWIPCTEYVLWPTSLNRKVEGGNKLTAFAVENGGSPRDLCCDCCCLFINYLKLQGNKVSGLHQIVWFNPPGYFYLTSLLSNW